MAIPKNTFEAVVKDMTSDGRGVVESPTGRKFFVAGVWRDEKIRLIQSIGASGKHEVTLQEILEPSTDRVAPVCPYHGHDTDTCGGCPWQFVSYQAQLSAKQSRVQSQLERIGVKYGVKIIIPSPITEGYRNRAQLKTDGSVLGFVAAKTNQIVDIDDCVVLDAANRRILRTLREGLPNTSWNTERTGTWRTIDICAEHSSQTVSVDKRLPFLQANQQQNNRLKQWLAEKLETLDRSLPVLELFAGSGNLTKVIAELGFTSVVAVDGAGESISQLQSLALPGVQALPLDLFDAASFKQLKDIIRPHVLVLDPPRDGLRERSDLFEKRTSIKDVFYVSCDLATLCRDLAFFREKQYKVREVQPVDMFPHTPHVELLVHLRKKGR